MRIQFPYGKSLLSPDISDERLKRVPVSGMHSYIPGDTLRQLVEQAR